MSLSGCNIKFIEKVESEPSTKKNTEESFGTIIIDPSSETEKSSATVKDDSEPSDEIKTTTQEASSEELPPEPDGTFKYSGITFIKNEQSPTMWVLEDCPAKQKPTMDSQDYSFLYKGDFVSLTAVSTDNKWAMVSIFGGPSSFVEYKNLTFEEVVINSTVEDLPTETPTETSSETTTQEQPTTQPSTQDTHTSQESTSTEPSVEPTAEPSIEQQPEDEYTGIAFPSNASSTSFNMGVEFADVTITLTVRKDGTLVSNGPDLPSDSSGYYSIASLNAGTTIKCTGIGRNGYIRVEYNGTIGFIDSRYVEY